MEFFNLSRHFPNCGVPFVYVIVPVFSKQKLKMSPYQRSIKDNLIQAERESDPSCIGRMLPIVHSRYTIKGQSGAQEPSPSRKEPVHQDRIGRDWQTPLKKV